MFYVKNPCDRNKAWTLSRQGDECVDLIPIEVTRCLKNYHLLGIEFLYHNYRRGMQGSILNEEPEMNFPLQVSAFFRAVIKGPVIILVICSRQTSRFWEYHLTEHGHFEVVAISNSDKIYKPEDKKLALLLNADCIKLGDNLVDNNFFSVVVDDLDQLVIKRVFKRLNGSFNIGCTLCNFYRSPNQKLQWSMLNWANPGCVGKLNDFYEVDSQNFRSLEDNYRHWWLRLTWNFCESFQKPTSKELQTYELAIQNWTSEHSSLPKQETATRKRKPKEPNKPEESTIKRTKNARSNKSANDKVVKVTKTTDLQTVEESKIDSLNDFKKIPIDKYVKLPSMDESPILTSIIRNFEMSPEPLASQTQSRAQCSSFVDTDIYNESKSVVLAFLEDKDRPSTSRSESEDFILNLI